MASEQSATWIESMEDSKRRDRLCTAASFLLNCFGSIHYLQIADSISFVLEDVRNFLLGMHSSWRDDAFCEVPFTIMDEFGFLKLNTSFKLDLTIVSKDELLLLFVVHHLSSNGKSHFEEVVKDLRNRAPPVISMLLSSASVPGKLEYLSKYPQYVQVDDTGHLKLPSSFILFKDSETASEAEGFSESETESDQSIMEQSVSVELYESSCITQKEFASKRIRASVLYLQLFFKLKPRKRCLCVILRVLEDVEIYFSNSSSADKVDVIQNSFVPNISRDPPPIVLSPSSSTELVSYLNRQEQEQLYFCYYTTHFCTRLYYNRLFKLYFGHGEGTAGSEKLSYLQKFDRWLSINEDGRIFKCVLPDLHLHASFMPYIFYLHDTVTSISSDEKTTNDTPESQDIWCKDNLIYKRLCSILYFLLHSFGIQPCDYLMKCIMHVSPDIGIFLNELSIEEQQEVFTSIPWVFRNADSYMELTAAYEFNTTYASPIELCNLHIVYNLIVNGETYGKKLIDDFSSSAPEANIPFYTSTKNSLWYKYLQRSKFWECNSSFYLTLPSWFYSSVDSLDVVSQTASRNDDPLLSSDFCVSQEELKSLGLPENILDVLAERMAECVAYLLKFFELTVHSNFLEIVLHLIKRGAAFFKLPPSHQEEVIRKCSRAFRIDEQGKVTCTHRQEKVNDNRNLTICMSYIIGSKGSVHYREAFEYYRNVIGYTNIFRDTAQREFFKNRKHYYLVCERGFVRLANFRLVEFDYKSILKSGSSAT